MALVIDTNILLYSANRACPEHQAARKFLETNGPIFIPDNVVYEFLRVATHPRVFPQPLSASEAIEFLDAILTNETCKLLSSTADHWLVLRRIISELGQPSGNLFFDIHTVTLMREHGIRRIVSADTDFRKFPGLEIIGIAD